MNILINDSQEIMSRRKKVEIQHHLFFSFAKFASRINGISVHFSQEELLQQVNCTINANVEGIGIVSITKCSNSLDDAFRWAVEATENRIAFRVDWNAWMNPDKLATWITSRWHTVRQWSGLQNSSTPA